MRSITDLRKAAREGLAYLKAQPDVKEAEVFVASNGNVLARLNYTSHIPSNGVEEPKSTESFGVGIRVALQTPEGIKTGFGSEASDITIDGVRRALDKARKGAVRDPEFVSLPRPTGEKPTLKRYHDPLIMRVHDRTLVDTGWMALERALEVFQSSEELLSVAGDPGRLRQLGLIVGGDVTMLQERIAVASSNFPTVQTDESTLVMAFLTAMVEGRAAKGGGWSVGSHLADYSGEAGAEAARNAIRAIGGVRVPDGKYRVIFGPQPVTDMFNHLILPGLQAGTFTAGASPFQGKLGQQVASELVTVYDDGAAPGLAATKAITCEGLPTGRTELVRDGRLVGLMSNYYEYQRLLNDPKGKEKLGADPKEHQQALWPRNGFRWGRGGGRQFDMPPTIGATNVVIESREQRSLDDLLRMVGDGLYIGRIWYTYPINGLAAGDFTCTVIGDSYLIKDGRLSTPIKPNTLRINDSIHNLLNSVLGISQQRRGTLVWAADQVIYAPEIAVSGITVNEIAEYMEEI